MSGQSKELVQKHKQGDCYIEANRLLNEHSGKGNIYWVYEERLATKGLPTGHYYLVLDGVDNNALALNVGENGYGQYPSLTVTEVLDRGKPSQSLKETLNRKL